MPLPAVGRGRRGRLEVVEEPALAAAAIVLLGLAGLDGARQDARSCARRASRQSNAPAWIKVSTQPLPTSLVETRSKKSSRLEERAPLLPRLDDRLDRLEPDPLDRPQPEVDLPLAGHPESTLPLVDVRRQHLDPHPPAVLDMLDEELVALGAVHLRREHGGHELGRVMGLEIGRLVGDQRIGRAVRLVEAVAAEVLDQVEDLGGLLPLQPALDGPLRRTGRGSWR